MKVARVCHIVNWYPNKWNEREALWTRRHVESLEPYCENNVFHVQVRHGKWSRDFYEISEKEHAFIFHAPINIWFFREILTTFLLFYVVFFKIKRKNYDIYNFQITYPLLTYSRIIGRILKKKIVVTEHWSAYHLNFGVTKKLTRIQRIFRNKRLRFIVVSKALQKDIESFSGSTIKAIHVPNAVENKIFNHYNQFRSESSFFMLSYWKKPKNPILILESFRILKDQGYEFDLVIGGFGPLVPEMEAAIDSLGLRNQVRMIGAISGNEIVEEMNKCSFFLHNSAYEVASVVCMEALMCGTPVIASNVGGIPEYLNESNGILVNEESVDKWSKAIILALNKEIKFDSLEIANQARNTYSKEIVGKQYFEALQRFMND